jgi:hypothetical protein
MTRSSDRFTTKESKLRFRAIRNAVLGGSDYVLRFRGHGFADSYEDRRDFQSIRSWNESLADAVLASRRPDCDRVPTIDCVKKWGALPHGFLLEVDRLARSGKAEVDTVIVWMGTPTEAPRVRVGLEWIEVGPAEAERAPAPEVAEVAEVARKEFVDLGALSVMELRRMARSLGLSSDLSRSGRRADLLAALA